MSILKKFNKKILFFFFIIIIAIVSVIYLISVSGGSLGSSSNIPFEGDYKNIGILDDRVFLLKGKSLESYDKDGNNLSKSTVPSETGTITGDKKNIVYYDNKKIYIIDKKGNIENSKTVKFEIKNIKLENNIIFISGHNNLLLLDLKGNEISSLKTDKDITTYELSEDENILLVTTIGLDNNRYKSDLYIKYIDRDEVISQTFDGEIIMYTEFLDNEEFLLASNKQILRMKDFEILAKRRITDFKGVGILKSNIYLLEGDVLNVFDLDFNLSNALELKGDFDNLFIVNNKVILTNKNSYGEYLKGSINNNSIDDVHRIIVNENGLYLIQRNGITRGDLELGE